MYWIELSWMSFLDVVALAVSLTCQRCTDFQGAQFVPGGMSKTPGPDSNQIRMSFVK